MDWKASYILREMAHDLGGLRPRDWAACLAVVGLGLLGIRAACLVIAALAGVMGL